MRCQCVQCLATLTYILLHSFFYIFLEFSIGSRQFSVEEPEDGASPRPVTLMVQRVGGTLGVVSVSWRVTSTSGKHLYST